MAILVGNTSKHQKRSNITSLYRMSRSDAQGTGAASLLTSQGTMALPCERRTQGRCVEKGRRQPRAPAGSDTLCNLGTGAKAKPHRDSVALRTDTKFSRLQEPENLDIFLQRLCFTNREDTTVPRRHRHWGHTSAHRCAVHALFVCHTGREPRGTGHPRGAAE